MRVCKISNQFEKIQYYKPNPVKTVDSLEKLCIFNMILILICVTLHPSKDLQVL